VKTTCRKLAAAALIAAAAALSAVAPAAGAEPREDAAVCPVCGREMEGALFQVAYKGVRLSVCSGPCRDLFEHLASAGRLDRITAAIEPRAALFQADSAAKPPLSRYLLLLGLYLLAGLITGGLSAFIAIRKGLGGGGAFAAGLVLGVVGLAIVLARSGGERTVIPEGHTRALKTRRGTRCPACGEPAHPSAARCARCASALSPAGQSEARLALGNIHHP
jgi:hypothetical protein